MYTYGPILKQAITTFVQKWHLPHKRRVFVKILRLYEQRKNIGKKRKDIIQTINLQGKRQNPREKTPVD